MKSEEYTVDDKLKIFNEFRKKKYGIFGYAIVKVGNRYAIASSSRSEEVVYDVLKQVGFAGGVPMNSPMQMNSPMHESKEDAFNEIWKRFDEFYPSFAEMELFNAVAGEEAWVSSKMT